MTNIFSRLKNQLARDNGGRYLGILLEQVMMDAPIFARALFPSIGPAIIRNLQSGKLVVRTECPFLNKHGYSKRADLAIVEKKTQEIIALAEIKYEDHLAIKNTAQLDDYIIYSAEHNVPFTFLTQRVPKIEHIEAIKKAASKNITHLFFQDIYRSTAAMSDTTVRWFRDFLRGEHVVYNDTFGSGADRALLLLLSNGLGLPHRNGLGNRLNHAANARAAAELLQHLLGNMDAVATWLSGNMREGRLLAAPFTTSFRFDPTWKLAPIRQAMTKPDSSLNLENRLPREARNGGFLWIWSAAPVRTNPTKNFIYVEFGIEFRLDPESPGKKGMSRLNTKLYSIVHGTGQNSKDYLSGADEVPINITSNFRLDEDRIKKVVVKNCHSALEELLSSSGLAAKEERILCMLVARLAALLSAM